MSYLRNNKALLLIIAVLLLTNIGVLYFNVWNKRPAMHRPSEKEMRERIKMQLKSEVGFSNEQLATYDSLRTKHFDSMKPLFEELKSAKDSFFNLVHQSNVSDSLITIYSAHASKKQQAIDLKMVRYFRSLKELCTDEQKPRMDSFLQNVTKRMSGGGHRGPGPDKNKK